MQASSYEFIPIRKVCRPIDDPALLTAGDNVVYTALKGGPTVYRPPEFFGEDDDLSALDLASPDRLSMRDWQVQADDTLVARLKDVILEKFSRVPAVTNTFNLFVADNVALAESYHTLKFNERIADLLGETRSFDLPEGPLRTKIHEVGTAAMQAGFPVFCIASRFAHHNYYHWMLESLPRLRFLDLLPDRDTIPIVVAGTELMDFHHQSLQALGIRNPLIILKSRLTRFDTLYCPTFLDPGAVTGRQVGWLRDRIFPAASLAGRSERPKRLYVSRRDAAARKVLNEDAVAAALEPLGFEVVVPGTLSLEQQVRTFASAEAVVATHGAGNTNLAFCRPGTVVVELVPDSFRQPHYWMLSSAAGLRYGRVLCDDRHPGGCMVVDPAKLRRVLAAAGLR